MRRISFIFMFLCLCMAASGQSAMSDLLKAYGDSKAIETALDKGNHDAAFGTAMNMFQEGGSGFYGKPASSDRSSSHLMGRTGTTIEYAGRQKRAANNLNTHPRVSSGSSANRERLVSRRREIARARNERRHREALELSAQIKAGDHQRTDSFMQNIAAWSDEEKARELRHQGEMIAGANDTGNRIMTGADTFSRFRASDITSGMVPDDEAESSVRSAEVLFQMFLEDEDLFDKISDDEAVILYNYVMSLEIEDDIEESLDEQIQNNFVYELPF